MPRRPGVFAGGLAYHVYSRVGRGEAPFELEVEALGKSREGVSTRVRRAARRRSEDEAFFRRMEDLSRRLDGELEAASSGCHEVGLGRTWHLYLLRYWPISLSSLRNCSRSKSVPLR
jgi:hypothetical protein